MKNNMLIILFVLSGMLFNINSFAQCTPADSISCPDPENNGEICPDSLNIGYKGEMYNQTFSILPPPTVNIYGTSIPLHHLKLIDIGNLPPGISWECNTDDSVFMAGQYNCVLFSGIPNDTGVYALRIMVQPFIFFLDTIISLPVVTDSTSLMMHIEKSNGIDTRFFSKKQISFWPNPFSKDFRMQIKCNTEGNLKMVVYTLQGVPVLNKSLYVVQGKNIIFLDGSQLKNGHYVVKLKNNNELFTGIVTKQP